MWYLTVLLYYIKEPLNHSMQMIKKQWWNQFCSIEAAGVGGIYG